MIESNKTLNALLVFMLGFVILSASSLASQEPVNQEVKISDAAKQSAEVVLHPESQMQVETVSRSNYRLR